MTDQASKSERKLRAGRRLGSGMGRRSWLSYAGVAGATLPTLWLPRRSRSATPVSAAVEHLIILNLHGGMRSTCMFNADVSQQWNPSEISGLQAGAAGTDWGVGGVFPAQAYAGGLWGEEIPSLPQISNRICVLGTVDHTPGEDRGDGGHASAQLRMGTGSPNGDRGLLSIIYRDHPIYADTAKNALPPVAIGGATSQHFAVAGGAFSNFRPIRVKSANDFRNNSSNDAAQGRAGWALDLGRRIDERFAKPLGRRHGSMVAGHVDAKLQAERFRPIFTNPILDVRNQPDAVSQGVSNAELMAALGTDNLAFDTALGLRMLGFDCPAIVVGHGGWDFHSGELTGFRGRAESFARTYAGLIAALQRMTHPKGGSYWDRSLVIVTSEFSRDNTEELTGFNSGKGSDHHGRAGSRYQALPFAGGVVGKGGKFFGATDRVTMEPGTGEPVFSSTSLLAMALDVLGIDPAPHFADRPLDAIF